MKCIHNLALKCPLVAASSLYLRLDLLHLILSDAERLILFYFLKSQRLLYSSIMKNVLIVLLHLLIRVICK